MSTYQPGWLVDGDLYSPQVNLFVRPRRRPRVLLVDGQWEIRLHSGAVYRDPELRALLARYTNATFNRHPMVSDDDARSGVLNQLAFFLEHRSAHSLGRERIEQIVEKAYYAGRSPKEALQAIGRAENEQRPPLKHIIPPRESWPVHPLRTPGRLPLAARMSWMREMKQHADGRFHVSVGPWRRTGRAWWSLGRLARCRDSFYLTRVYINGGGVDDELRFLVSAPDGDFKLGASNDFINAPGLAERLNLSWSRLGARGLANPSAEDTLVVMRWCDEQIDKLLSKEP